MATTDIVSNALYYTFSTIAQTLAGAIALLAAFVLYRLQTFKQELVRDGNRVAIPLEQLEPRAHEMVELGKYQELLDAASKAAYPPGDGQAKNERARLEASVQTHKALVGEFRFALYLTAVTIAYSVAALVFAPLVLSHAPVAKVTLGLGFLAFAWCVVKYVMILRSSVA